MRDGLVDTVFHDRTEHIPVEQPPEEAQAVEKVEVETVDSSGAKAKVPGEGMVVHRNMITNRFLPGMGPIVQHKVPPPLIARGQKRTRNTNQPFERLEDAPSRSPPTPTTTVVTIREPVISTRPLAQVGSNFASSSVPPVTGWQNIFMFGKKPLLVTFSIRNWSSGEGGQIARSLGLALQLPNDVRYLMDGSDGTSSVRL